jgi:hypothetical protein
MGEVNAAPTIFLGRVGCYGVLVRGTDPDAAHQHSSYVFRPPQG